MEKLNKKSYLEKTSLSLIINLIFKGIRIRRGGQIYLETLLIICVLWMILKMQFDRQCSKGGVGSCKRAFQCPEGHMLFNEDLAP